MTVAGRAWRQSSPRSSAPGVMLSIHSIPQVPGGASRTATVRPAIARSTSHLSESLSSPGPSSRAKFGSWNRYSPSGPVTTASLSRSLSSNAARSARSALELTRTGAVVGILFVSRGMCCLNVVMLHRYNNTIHASWKAKCCGRHMRCGVFRQRDADVWRSDIDCLISGGRAECSDFAQEWNNTGT